MKYFLLALLVLVTGCTRSKGCQDQISTATVVAQIVALKLNCNNVYQIEADLDAKAQTVGFCAPSPSPVPMQKGRVGSIFVNATTCNFFGQLAVNGAIEGNIPDSWGCDDSLLTQPVDQLITKACNSIY
jgi:hypothetical protein